MGKKSGDWEPGCLGSFPENRWTLFPGMGGTQSRQGPVLRFSMAPTKMAARPCTLVGIPLWRCLAPSGGDSENHRAGEWQ